MNQVGFVDLPSDVWLLVILDVAVEDAQRDGELILLEDLFDSKVNEKAVNSNNMLFRSIDNLASLGLSCKKLHNFFESMVLFSKPFGFQRTNNKLKYHCAYRFQNAMEFFHAPDLLNFHVKLLTRCILSMPWGKWKHLVQFDLYNLDYKLKLAEALYYHKKTTSKRREEIAKNLLRFATDIQVQSCSEKVISVLQKMLHYEPLPATFGHANLELNEPWIASYECLENFINYLVEFLRSTKPSFHLIARMNAWGNRVQNLSVDFVNIVDVDPIRSRTLYFLHPHGRLTNETLQGSCFLHRASAVLFCTAIALKRPKDKLEKLVSFLTFHDYIDIFQESDILAYTPLWIDIEPYISHVLIYMTRSVVKKMGYIKSLLKSENLQILNDSESYLSQLVNIISLSYKFQISEPLYHLLSVGFPIASDIKIKLARMLTRSLETISVCRPRNYKVSMLLWDLCKKVMKAIPSKSITHLHIHPFLAPCIFYRFSKNILKFGFSKCCSLTCLGIHSLPKTSHPFVPTLLSISHETSNMELKLILTIIDTLENFEIPIICNNIGNVSVVTAVALHLYETKDPKLYGFLQWVMNVFPLCPSRNPEGIIFEHCPIDIWILNFKILVGYLSKRSKLDTTNFEKEYVLPIKSFVEKLIGWGAYVRTDRELYRKWKEVISKRIASVLARSSMNAIALLVPILYDTGCLKLLKGIMKRCCSAILQEIDIGLNILCRLISNKRHYTTLKVLVQEYAILFETPLKFFTRYYEKEKGIFGSISNKLMNSFISGILLAPQNVVFLLDFYGYTMGKQFISDLARFIVVESKTSKRIESAYDLIKYIA